MEIFKEIQPEEISENAFKLIGKDWMLVTSSADDKINTMTASWGGFGVLWGKNVAYIVVRPQRYTKEFIDKSGRFSLTFFNDSFRSKLSYLGTVSGRDEDKIKKSGLTVSENSEIPFFEEGKLAAICKVLYKQKLTPDSFLDSSIADRWYPDHDFHTLYVAEIEKVFVKSN
ncbi:flavin reductase [Tyzzerella sp. An114]|nr:flavin reductase [Tyzzerella sp. An114]OUQ60439.1 flavin reductase [Tyzzerella sp. An114]